MSAVIATPELMAQAATDLASIGSTVNAAHIVAAAPTLSVLPAAADEVSADIAHLFSQHAQEYQALAGKAAAFQDQFVQHMTVSAVSYTSAEAVNVASLLPPLTAIADSIGSAVTAAQNVLNDLVSNIQLILALLEILLIAFIILFITVITSPLWLPFAGILAVIFAIQDVPR